MSAISTPISVRMDAALDEVQRQRDRVLAGAPSAWRSARIAELYEREARLWSLVFERSRSRLAWRAALAAEAYAGQCARAWRRRAAAEGDGDSGRSDSPRALAASEGSA